MEQNDQEPLTDEQLSAVLQKWSVGAAPGGLDSRAWAQRRASAARRRAWVLIPAASCGLAFAAGAAVWLLRPVPQRHIAVAQVQRDAAVETPVAHPEPVETARLHGNPASTPPEPQSTYRGSVSIDFFSGPAKASPFDAKPLPEPWPQDARAEAPLPAGVYRSGNGVSAPNVMQKKQPEYSEEARIAKLSGTTLVQIVVGEDGTARNINVLRPLGLGLDEKGMESIRAWRFKPGVKDGAAVSVLASIEINFRLDRDASQTWYLTRALFNPPAGAMRPVLTAAPYPPDAGSSLNDSVRVSFDVDENGVPINLRGQTSQGKAPANPALESEATAILSGWRFQPAMKDGKPVSVPANFDFTHVAAPDAAAAQASSQPPIHLSREAAAGSVVDKTAPAYPPEAKAGRLQGVVSLAVRIGKDGHVTSATVISGDPLLAQAALEAVRQWLYRPTLLNGTPVEVETQVDVNFTLK
jgi:TonB family protein